MFYTRLKEVCALRGLKVTNIVNELGFSPSRQGDWSNGKSPSVESLIKFATRLEVSTDYLLGLTDNYEVQNGKKD